MLSAAVAGALFVAPAALAAAPAPRVAIIVGPTGDLTNGFRAIANRAATAARAAGADVVTAYSPNATWPVVRQALQGASIVVYLGHGNGWPSRYTKKLNPETQDGLGLNPVAGVNDTAHRYFGEKYLAAGVRLAPNAIVLLHGLCYASGNSEPGLTEGTLDVAKQRADNFAAGWLRAGAAAVVADTFGSPAYYISSILRRAGSIEAIWRSSPTFHRHVIAYESRRTAGATALLDPTRPNRMFYRSIVGRLDTSAGDFRPPAATVAPAGQALAARSGPAVDTVRLESAATPSTSASLVLGLTATKGSSFDVPLGVGVEWLPLELDEAAAPSDLGPAAQARPVDEAPGQVALVPAPSATGGGVAVPVEVPRQQGVYRVVVTLFDGTGVAFDAATQQAVPALVVRVGPTGLTVIATTDRLELLPGTSPAGAETPDAVGGPGRPQRGNSTPDSD